jgi:hypothetical protein
MKMLQNPLFDLTITDEGNNKLIDILFPDFFIISCNKIETLIFI